MAEKVNNHWIPRHHLRLFAGARSYIHLVLRRDSRIVLRAGIKNQCARHKFYGAIETENRLQAFETRHAIAYRVARSIATGEREERLATAELACLREALLLQHARTPRYARTHARAGDQMALYAYHGVLASRPPTPKTRRILRAIEEGRASLRHSEARSLAYGVASTVQLTPFVADLRLLMLRNETGSPFLMGDAPCLFTNEYMRDVQDTGVLGLSQRGLMISMPLDSVTALLLFDDKVYRAARYDNDCVAVRDMRDVEKLNALQVCGAEDCVYFADEALARQAAEFVALWSEGKDDEAAGFEVLRAVGVDNSGPRDEVLHTYERQLPVALDLSFVRTRDRPPKVNVMSPRRPKLFDRIEPSEAPRGLQRALSVEQLADWVESELVVQDRPPLI